MECEIREMMLKVEEHGRFNNDGDEGEWRALMLNFEGDSKMKTKL